MKKRNTNIIFVITITLALLLAVTVRLNAQTYGLEKAFKDYMEYCNQLVPDTIKQTGIIRITDLPVYDGDIIICYKKVAADTTWNKIKCEEYKDDYNKPRFMNFESGMYYTSGSTTNTSYILARKDYNIEVTRDYVCHIQREKPSQAGFYKWLFYKLH